VGMVVDWPDGQDELVFTEGVPAHARVKDVPGAYSCSRG
jgi:hypothetical protein